MTEGPAGAKRFRLPPGEWVRQHILQLVTLGTVAVLVFACCNPPAWPTVVWEVAAHDCGTVQSGVGGVISPADAARAETCFAQAYPRCSAAKLSASFTEVDSGGSDSFVIEPYGFTCAVAVLWSFSGPMGFSGSHGFGYYRSVRMEANGLRVLGCQTIGTVFLPDGA